MASRFAHTAVLPLRCVVFGVLLLVATAGDAQLGNCSCASPSAVPLPGQSMVPSDGVWLNGSFHAAANPAASDIAAASALVEPTILGASNAQLVAPSWWQAIRTGICRSLPTAKEGGQCGADIAICEQGLCCSQGGTCSRSEMACDSTCQCPFSGVGSACKGSFPANSPNPQFLPIAVAGSVCAPSVAVCGADHCCTQVIVVNNQPMTMLKAAIGDRVVLSVTNRLKEPVSLEFHGVPQHGSNTILGSSLQRPIKPNGVYTYTFIANIAGTYWWHSTMATQTAAGLFGPLVISNPAEPEYSGDSVVAISDWYHITANQAVPDGVLINFKGTSATSPAVATKVSSYSLIKGAAARCGGRPASMTRLRLLNTARNAMFRFSVDNHRMVVISQDTVGVEAVEVGTLIINGGQRYDVLLCQRTAAGAALSKEPVFMRATMLGPNAPVQSARNTALAILQLSSSSPRSLPTTQPTAEPPFMSPLRQGPRFVSPYDQRMQGRPTPPDASKTATFAVSSLEDIAAIQVYICSVPAGQVVDIVIDSIAEGGVALPIYLQRHWLWIMAAGQAGAGPYVDGTPLLATLARDTVTVNSNSYLVVRYIAEGSAQATSGASKCSGSPANPANAVFDCGSSTLADKTCTATCNSGYSPADGTLPSAVCQSSGQWSAITGSCIQTPDAVCSSAPDNAHNAEPFSCGNGPKLGHKCSTKCGPGLTGRPTVTCQSDGTRSAPDSECTQKGASKCSGSPTNPANAVFDCGSSTLADKTCTATCNSGYSPADGKPPSAVCQSSGQWSTITGSCIQAPDAVCSSAPDNAHNAEPFSCGNGPKLGHNCSTKCDPGFTGRPTVTCQSDGTWSAPDSECTQKGASECTGSPTNPANAVFDCGSSTLADKTCTATCNSGYSPADGKPPSAVCQSSGQWSAITGFCIQTPDAVCSSAPDNAPNAEPFSCGNGPKHGHKCSTKCGSGFTGRPTVTCQPDGTWSAPDSKCTQKECVGSPTSLGNGSSFECGERSLPGTTCNASCLPGFKGSYSSTCGEDGSWGNMTVCSSVPGNVDNAKPFSCGAGTLPRQNCSTSCNSGYTGSPTVTCQPDGTWSAADSGCTQIVCSSRPEKFNKAKPFSCGTSMTPGQNCSTSCNSGYTGSPTVTCQPDGTWSAPDSGCTDTVCSSTPDKVNKAKPFSRGTGMTPGQKCSTSCNSGYTGSPTVTCQSDGTWSAPDSGCT